MPWPLEDREFGKLRQLVRASCGIVLGPNKRQLCQTRVGRRLRALGLRSYAEYLELLARDPAECGELVNAITTNVTAFFREPHHFEVLAGTILPALAAQHKRLRLWSAGCSTGEEPWSLAMTIREALGPCTGLDVKVLATDIDTRVLARATAGCYPAEALAPISVARRQRFFEPVDASTWRIKDDLRSLVTFKPLNLLGAWPMHGPFDVIMCRNVIIYFDTETRTSLLARYRDLLAPTGYLVLGHSESLTGVAGFSLAGHTVYRRTP